jgi:prepilin-type N-terminal cleavage/methylation domain-containing protein
VKRLRGLFPVSPILSEGPGDSDAGFSLVEMVVALMVFAIISLGVAYSMLAVLSSTRDTRGRQVAANLAAEEIDRARAVGSIFELEDDDRTVVVDNVTYTIDRQTEWKNSAGSDDSCGAGSGSLQFKIVNVVVTWPGVAGETGVRADTVVAPSSKINDPAFGTIVVRVTDRYGIGVPGATVTAAPAAVPEGALAIEGTIAPTDSDGCAFVLKAAEGSYDVKVSKAGYVDVDQRPTPSINVKVSKGTATSALVTYDLAATLNVTYASNFSGSVLVPSNLDVSLQTTYGVALLTKASSYSLFPFNSGYSVFTGQLAGASNAAPACSAIDPTLWPSATEGASTIAGAAVPSVAVASGTSSTVAVPMGVVKISNPSTSSGSWSTIRAQRVAPVAGSADPGCALIATVPEVLTIGSLSRGSSVNVALPYGTWKITRVASGSDVAITNLSVMTRGSVSSNVVTLDPRTPVVP